MSKINESKWKVTRSDSNGLQRHTASDGSLWFWGVIRTPHGYVYVYAETKHLRLCVMRDGYEFTRVIKRTYSQRGIVTQARLFIEEQQP